MNLFASASACLCVLAAPAAATPEMLDRCAPRIAMLGQLAHSYAEFPRAWHLVNPKRVLEVLASAEGTWTIIITTVISTPAAKQRISCVLKHSNTWSE